MAFSLTHRLIKNSNEHTSQPFNPSTTLWVSRLLLAYGAKVELDFMGRSEFEDSTLLDSVNRISRAARSLTVITEKVQLPARAKEDVNFVCTPEQADLQLPLWRDWSREPQTLEPTGYNDLNDLYSHSGAWWALEEDLIWSRDVEIATNIKNAMGAMLTAAEAGELIR